MESTRTKVTTQAPYTQAIGRTLDAMEETVAQMRQAHAELTHEAGEFEVEDWNAKTQSLDALDAANRHLAYDLGGRHMVRSLDQLKDIIRKRRAEVKKLEKMLRLKPTTTSADA
jgi:hypothetical protein